MTLHLEMFHFNKGKDPLSDPRGFWRSVFDARSHKEQQRLLVRSSGRSHSVELATWAAMELDSPERQAGGGCARRKAEIPEKVFYSFLTKTIC